MAVEGEDVFSLGELSLQTELEMTVCFFFPYFAASVLDTSCVIGKGVVPLGVEGEDVFSLGELFRSDRTRNMLFFNTDPYVDHTEPDSTFYACFYPTGQWKNVVRGAMSGTGYTHQSLAGSAKKHNSVLIKDVDLLRQELALNDFFGLWPFSWNS